MSDQKAIDEAERQRLRREGFVAGAEWALESLPEADAHAAAAHVFPIRTTRRRDSDDAPLPVDAYPTHWMPLSPPPVQP